MLPQHRRTPENLILPEDSVATSPVGGLTAASHSRLSRPGVEVAGHFDLVIIGAGPAALAVISRILESRPAALYTEDEIRHLSFAHRQNQNSGARSHRGRKQKSNPSDSVAGDGSCPREDRIKILVIDKVGEGFMGLWRRNFRALGISHLRSPMLFHPDASDLDALIAYANQNDRAEEGTPDHIVECIEQRVALGQTSRTDRSRGARSGRKHPRQDATLSAVDPNATSSNPRWIDGAALPDLIEILGVVGKEKSKHKCRQQLLHSKENQHTIAAAAKLHREYVNERNRQDYFVPSAALFNSFTCDLSQKYGVKSCDNRSRDAPAPTWQTVSQYFHGEACSEGEGSVTTLKGRVKDLAWLDGGKQTVQDDFGNHHPGFFLELDDNVQGTAANSDGTIISAKTVVSAVSFGGVPNIPSYLVSARPCGVSATAPSTTASSSPCSSAPASIPAGCGPGWMHSSCLAAQPFPRPHRSPSCAPARERRIVVVGGGLTSAQVVVRALEEGYDKVTLLLRGHLKSKPFDVDLSWAGRYSNILKMSFWQNDRVQERLDMIREARNGGSVNPMYSKVLSRLQALGKVEIRTQTCISTAAYVPLGSVEGLGDEHQMDAEFSGIGNDTGGECQWRIQLQSHSDGEKTSQICADYLIVATGSKVDFGGLSFLQGLQQTHPIKLAEGMPVLTADLEYRSDVPLFVTGAYAGLQIGPWAGNLGGMRDSADRIGRRLWELLDFPEGEPTPVAKRNDSTNVGKTEVAGRKGPSTRAQRAQSNGPRKGSLVPFTHFNYDLLSVEA